MKSILNVLKERESNIRNVLAKASKLTSDNKGLEEELRQVMVAISLIEKNVNYIDWEIDLGEIPFVYLPRRKATKWEIMFKKLFNIPIKIPLEIRYGNKIKEISVFDKIEIL